MKDIQPFCDKLWNTLEVKIKLIGKASKLNINIRQRTEQIESKILSKWAARSADSKGRDIPEEPCSLRTIYQCDRDRIIHSKSFRRLKRKTQVFMCPEGDHYRTRLTHTLEVSQIARTVSRALRLNEDLTEAIALGHDLGHTPFGHSGEEILNSICPGGFRHFEQSVRVVEVLEKDGKGLNLTKEVRNGILNHTKGVQPDTMEGKVVRLCDKIAYINHDIDDALRAGVLKVDDIPKSFLQTVGASCSERVNTMVCSLVENTVGNELRMSEETDRVFNDMHNFMYENVYLCKSAKPEEKKALYIVEWLYKYFKENENKLPEDIQKICKLEGMQRGVCDYIAGMTDDYAINLFKDLFIPKPWRGIRNIKS